MVAHSELAAWLMPTKAQEEWLRLTSLLNELVDEDVPCRDGDPAAWWPEGKESDFAMRYAVDGCRRCPIAAACLEYAIAADERFGVWGATTPGVRRDIKLASTA